MDSELDPALVVKMARQLMAAKMYSLSACVMLFYDIAITFPDEVEKIWMQPRYTYMTLLWALNRYLAPLGYIVIIASFHMDWAPATCERYVLYPEALKIVITLVIGIIFVLRLYAIYGKNLTVAATGGALLVAELSIKIWAFTDGTRLDLPPGLIGCILVGRHHIRFSFTWISELIFDTVVFILTFHRTFLHYRFQRAGGGKPLTLLTLIMRDGVTYFAVIFAANAITVSIFLWSREPGIRAINATFSTLITSLMVSRLILKSAAQSPAIWGTTTHGMSVLESISYRGDDDEDDSKGDERGGVDGRRFQVGITTEGPTGAIELSNLFVTRQEMGKISKLGRSEAIGLTREKRLSKMGSSGV